MSSNGSWSGAFDGSDTRVFQESNLRSRNVFNGPLLTAFGYGPGWNKLAIGYPFLLFKGPEQIQISPNNSGAAPWWKQGATPNPGGQASGAIGPWNSPTGIPPAQPYLSLADTRPFALPSANALITPAGSFQGNPASFCEAGDANFDGSYSWPYFAVASGGGATIDFRDLLQAGTWTFKIVHQVTTPKGRAQFYIVGGGRRVLVNSISFTGGGGSTGYLNNPTGWIVNSTALLGANIPFGIEVVFAGISVDWSPVNWQTNPIIVAGGVPGGPPPFYAIDDSTVLQSGTGLPPDGLDWSTHNDVEQVGIFNIMYIPPAPAPPYAMQIDESGVAGNQYLVALTGTRTGP